jgi:hypothetical protein
MSGRQSNDTTERSALDRWLPRLAWLVWVVTVGMLVWQVWIWSMPPSILDVTRLVAPSGDVVEAISIRQTSLWLACLLSATMGALIASLRPRNPIGWWLGVLALAFTANVFGSVYARYAIVRNPGALPHGDLALWLAEWCIGPMFIALICLLLLFPSGRLRSSHYKPVLGLAIAAVAFFQGERVFTPGPIETTPFSIPNNPFAISWMPSFGGRGTVGLLLYGATLVVAVVGLIYRLRRARGVERQQLKWFVFGAAWFPLIMISPTLVALGYPADGLLTRDVIPVAYYVIILLVLVAMTIGILQYRLFDIDVIINRTLVYGIVTALLAGAFAALSIVTQRLTLAVTGQESEVAVVLAALVVTALFQPLRARVQILVDRRFYRSKYDAARTLEQFAGQVRDEVELDHLRSVLVAVVDETMQPAHVSLWIRPAAPTTNRLR